ncbi:MAG: FliH/SctL family protein [Peptostreptococcaceae bacterium]
MSLLCKNRKILRKEDVSIKGKVSLNKSEISNESIINLSERLLIKQEKLEKQIQQAKEEYEDIIQKTQQKKESILEEASERAINIERQAYEKGYEQGLKNGYEDGYKESYESNIEKALQERKEITDEAYKTLFNINKDISSYIENQKSEILRMSIAIAEQVLRDKFEEESSMNIMIENIIKEYSMKKNMIIKVNSLYENSLKNQINTLKENLSIQQDIFVISDNKIEKGNAHIQTQNGILTVGIDSVLDRVKSELI